MIHTEDELRAALAEGVSDAPPDVREIVRRGRRIRRRRAVAGAALAVAVTAVVAFPVQGLWRDAEPVKEPPTAARISPSSTLPLENSLGAPLIRSYRFTTVPAGATVTFRPLSVYTSYRVVCADPETMVVIRAAEGGGSVGRCGGSGAENFYDGSSVTSDWLERPQRLKLWVLPGDTPIDSSNAHPTSYDGCEVVRKEVGLCDGRYKSAELLRPGVVERVAAELERRPGRWEVGFYDRVVATAPREPTPRVTVTVGPDDRAGTTARREPAPTVTVTVGPDDRAGTTAWPEPTPTRTVTVRP